MPITSQERLGIADLLVTEQQNMPVLLNLAKSITKNVCDISTSQEALDYIYTHMGDTQMVLNKRHITKEILFKYLHNKKVAVNTDFTKGTLINKVIEYWNTSNGAITETSSSDAATNFMVVAPQNPQTETELPTEAQYPINLLARKFSEWFFTNYNDGKLTVADFWTDAHLQLRFIDNEQVNDHECTGSEVVINSLMSSKMQFGFYFNPNLTHAGVQGRMDVHGLVLVLVCGTLHTQQECVGVFECNFGLLRDPFAENNWKVKTCQCSLRSKRTANTPSLYESDTLKAALQLPVPIGGEFT